MRIATAAAALALGLAVSASPASAFFWDHHHPAKAAGYHPHHGLAAAWHYNVKQVKKQPHVLHYMARDIHEALSQHFGKNK